MQKISRRRNHRIIMAMAIFIFLGTGFVAAGGDATIVNYFTHPTQTDDDGQPVYQYEPLLSKVIRHVHAHFGHHVKNEH